MKGPWSRSILSDFWGYFSLKILTLCTRKPSFVKTQIPRPPPPKKKKEKKRKEKSLWMLLPPALQNYYDIAMCGSRKYPYPPHGGSLEIARGRGVLKAKILEAMYDNKPEFPGGGEMQNNKPHVGGVWIFSGKFCTI